MILLNFWEGGVLAAASRESAAGPMGVVMMFDFWFGFSQSHCAF